jgi:hypothetical protein
MTRELINGPEAAADIVQALQCIVVVSKLLFVSFFKVA